MRRMLPEVATDGEIGIDDFGTRTADAAGVGTLAWQRADAAGVRAAAWDSPEHADVVAAGLPPCRCAGEAGVQERTSQQRGDVHRSATAGDRTNETTRSFCAAGICYGCQRGPILTRCSVCSRPCRPLVQTCKHLQINPFVYLRDVIERVSTHPARLVLELTPREWKRLRQVPAQAVA